MIEQLEEGQAAYFPGDGTDNPPFAATERAHLICGCSIWVGVRLDNMESSTMGVPCSVEHDGLIGGVVQDLILSTLNPRDDPLVEVCDEYLERAAGVAN